MAMRPIGPEYCSPDVDSCGAGAGAGAAAARKGIAAMRKEIERYILVRV